MTEITMPKLGESVTEGTIENWLVKVGDHVSEYDPICEVNTAKVTAEVPSVHDGVITEILVEEGKTVEVGVPIYKIEVDGGAAEPEVKEEEVETAAVKDDEPVKQNKPAVKKQSGDRRLSPVVMRLIGEHNINIDELHGTGFNGRITKKDVEKYLADGPSEQPAQKAAASTPAPEKAAPAATASVKSGESIKVSGVRKEIARRMVQSSTEIPHAWLMMEVDATNMVNLRNKHKARFKEQEGYNLTFFSFFVKAVSEVLKDYPILNSSWDDDTITVHDDINLSIAVANEDKLFVPVIKNADERSLTGIAKSISTLANKARSNKLTGDDMAGGTFTVNNTGAFGSVQSMGIINQPQVAILQVESIVRKPVFIGDMLASRHMVNLCLSIDHRVLDGLVAGQFLKAVKEKIENLDPDADSVY
ncbi:dihydrolipoamide acetyltransferase component of pyruvate dehydrogenase complex [Jeotgalicoccus coquinae]|uniref:Dihydrolipoamide acetyltransferase component of pyruvate dehydrogenase complex n=1 Tax=Jeotgalicoccus coquinae TaxID=709509 RepID=A0A6V7R8I0_9STAP|nr:dihydrolipoamide acetyltransferase family protein [Jeotgalicoccus coquinae]MBB6422909.1 2-oxoisovalerate dehydrogenase E2 component (dihydrolipoyl transacylase) [Jeotgalicoccus coquinae]GGE12163.1 dihydrolipoamide acetyltransferase component of pyruvate dehydrogenase complex [Jeotgalicoccus coquinae]CAD2073671.1 Dihydrolipoyllysine-residue succinyltransferase component of 2-oxoglutarate dehydrogenase complex [Jeotgalicoccus coquinae]